ncbi:winged helix-turn-helix domain-containing protein [Halovivax limisalsi]|uniref:winged helix-turn-helix domain-containing protein n=1 Tax=Halovivax limisalsi TaxID=1453760 RepID=UPI001FFDC5A8|nr:winged helix-turn-helix domain-containing protein [Halovivax limisalsi]
MEQALWYLFVGSRGGANRAKIVTAIDECPRNANRIAEAIDVDYNTVRYHLEKLEEHNVIERGQDGYGAMYFLTDQFDAHREQFDEILTHVE